MNITKKLNLELILISMIPISAIFSIFFKLSLLIITSLFLIDIFKKKNFTVFNNVFSKVFIIFYLYLIVRLFFTDYFTDEFLSIFFYFIYFFYIISIFYFLKKYSNLEKYFLIVTIFTFCILLFDGFFQFFNGKNIVGYTPVHGRITSFFGDESILGSYLIKFLPFIYLFIFKNQKKTKVLIFFIFLLAATCILIFLSGERAAIILMILLTLYFIVMVKELKLFRIIFFLFPYSRFLGYFFLMKTFKVDMFKHSKN